jgi:hypothetical protein
MKGLGGGGGRNRCGWEWYDRHVAVSLVVSAGIVVTLMILKGLCNPVVVGGAWLKTCGGGGVGVVGI